MMQSWTAIATLANQLSYTVKRSQSSPRNPRWNASRTLVHAPFVQEPLPRTSREYCRSIHHHRYRLQTLSLNRLPYRRSESHVDRLVTNTCILPLPDDLCSERRQPSVLYHLYICHTADAHAGTEFAEGQAVVDRVLEVAVLNGKFVYFTVSRREIMEIIHHARRSVAAFRTKWSAQGASV